MKYREWLEVNEPVSSFLKEIEGRTCRIRPPSSKAEVRTPEKYSRLRNADTVEYGAPINFRGLRHAPINEQGVVYLFGLLADELGFQVEAVRTTFPDCEAKRSVDKRGQRWQKVRIEFEYQSSNFQAHGHDSDKCEVIVCWEHDWPDCPLEVVELRRLVISP